MNGRDGDSRRGTAARNKPGKSGASGRPVRQSGPFSSDPIFDPTELFEVLEREDDLSIVSDAMRRFLEHGDESLFARAVAIFVRSARSRGETVEQVLGTLEAVADRSEGTARMGSPERASPLRQRILRGLLLAFYGAETVDRENSARERRTQDTTEGTARSGRKRGR